MLEVTTIASRSRVDSQALGELCQRLVDNYVLVIALRRWSAV